jgi:hypothetical protein
MYVFAALLIGESSGCGGGHTSLAGPSTLGPPPPPTLAVTAVTPSVGSTAGGTGVLLNGTNFQNGVVASIDGVAQQTFFGNSSFVALSTTPHAAGPVDILITNPDGKTTLVSGKYSFALPQSFDFNGTWDAYRESSEDLLFRFTIQNNALISITCGSSTPIVFSTPPSVVNGEFSFTGTIGSLSGRILAAGQATGPVDVPGCGSGVWFAFK